MWAAAAGHAPVVRVLIEFGANIHLRSDVRRRRIGTEFGGYDAAAAREIDKGGYTPLLFATQQGSLESVKLLIAAGADPNETAPEGNSALVVAAHSGHGAVAAFLLENGADPNASEAGYTALHAAVLRGDVELVTPARRNSADYALEFDLVGATPFWLSAHFVEPALMEILAANGADTTFVMKDGTTPVMAAIQTRRRAEPGLTPDPIRDEQRALDAVALAIDQGVDVNAARNDGNTALHVAVSRRLGRVIELLVERGARLDVENKKGQTPLALASAGGSGTRESLSPEILRKLGAKDAKD
jgi:ankyrin repeat protein